MEKNKENEKSNESNTDADYDDEMDEMFIDGDGVEYDVSGLLDEEEERHFMRAEKAANEAKNADTHVE
jgi:hypothetical protein